MQAEHLAIQAAEPRPEIADLIRECYPRLQKVLPSPYVDGYELFEAFVALGHGGDARDPGSVALALGPKGLGLPVANLGGKPKYYLPRAVSIKEPESWSLTQQVTGFVHNVRTFAQC
jgi:hypothetical protein